MSHFLAFTYSDYYPGGAPSDFVGNYGSMDEANTNALAQSGDHQWVYDVSADEWTEVTVEDTDDAD